jgi:hypothetical protein
MIISKINLIMICIWAFERCLFMEYGYMVQCPKCNFQETYMLGVGMGFPRVYMRVVGEIKKGKYGKNGWSIIFISTIQSSMQ